MEQFLRDLDELLEQPTGTALATQALADCDGWNSMIVLGLLALADEKYGASLKPSALVKCATFADIYELVRPEARN